MEVAAQLAGKGGLDEQRWSCLGASVWVAADAQLAGKGGRASVRVAADAVRSGACSSSGALQWMLWRVETGSAGTDLCGGLGQDKGRSGPPCSPSSPITF